MKAGFAVLSVAVPVAAGLCTALAWAALTIFTTITSIIGGAR